jgi:hypothetical protein
VAGRGGESARPPLAARARDWKPQTTSFTTEYATRHGNVIGMLMFGAIGLLIGATLVLVAIAMLRGRISAKKRTRIAYHLEVTSFEPAPRTSRSILERTEDVVALLTGLSGSAVVLVEAIEGNIDHGNFYLFLNDGGRAHVMLHEHCEFLACDPLSADAVDEVVFLYEDGTEFSVPGILATSADRGRAALKRWLPRQERWAEFTWE